jgi:hypothetical protein
VDSGNIEHYVSQWKPTHVETFADKISGLCVITLDSLIPQTEQLQKSHFKISIQMSLTCGDF